MAKKKKTTIETIKKNDPLMPKAGETNKVYMKRLTQQKEVTPKQTAAIIATTWIMSNRGPEQMADPEQVSVLAQQIVKQPSFRRMMKEEQTKTIVVNGTGTDLCSYYAEYARRDLEANKAYTRSPEQWKADRQLLDKAYDQILLKNRLTRSWKETGGRHVDDGISDPSLFRQGEVKKNIKEFNRKYGKVPGMLEGFSKATEKPPEPDQIRKLVKRVKRVLRAPAGMDKREIDTDLCILQRFMPEEEFKRYCRELNRNNKGKEGWTNVQPEDYGEALLNGEKNNGFEFVIEARGKFLAENQFNLDAYAELAAAEEVSRGSNGRIVSREEVLREKEKLLAPTSMFRRYAKEYAADKQLKKEITNKVKLEYSTFCGIQDTKREAQKLARRTAQYQVNRSIRALTEHGPVNEFLATEHLANILAAREFAWETVKLSDGVTNGDFQERARRMQEDPAFRRIAERYALDPEYRASINRSLADDKSAAKLGAEYQKQQLELQLRRQRAEQRKAQQEERKRQEPEKQGVQNNDPADNRQRPEGQREVGQPDRQAVQ